MADVSDPVPYQSLYRRFRPATFAAVRGQDHVVLALRNAVREGRVAHAYLFSGPRGTGKTSTARILAKALNCTDLHDGEPCGTCQSCTEIARGTSLDVHELDAASNNGVDAMRDLVARAALGTPGRQKVYIVDEVHMLSTAASNALLKTLEEPPAHVVFVLATTDPQKVLPTIRSRTQHFEFRLLGADTLSGLLDDVRAAAGLAVDDQAVELAVRRGRGSARDALSVLDQVAASEVLDDDLPELDGVAGALAAHDAGACLAAVARLVESGFAPQQLAGDLVELLRQAFLAAVAPDLVSVVGSDRSRAAAVAEAFGLAAVVRAIEVLGQAQVGMRDAPDPRVNLEVALVRLATPGVDTDIESLLQRVEALERTVNALAAGPGGAPPAPRPPEPRSARPLPGSPAPAPAEPPTSTAPHAPEPPAGEPSVPGPPADDGGGAPSTRPSFGALRRQAGLSDRVPRGGDGGPPEVARSAGPSEPAEPAGSGEAAAAPPPGPPEPEPEPEPAPAPVAAPGPGPDVARSSAPPAAGFPTRDELVQAWGDTVLSGLRPKAKALYQAGRFVGVAGERAVFGLPNDIHRQRCEEVRTDVEAALADHFGRPVPLALVVDDGSAAPLSSPSPAPGTGTGTGTGSTVLSPHRPGGAGPVPPARTGGPRGGPLPVPDEPGPAGGAPDGPDDEYELLDESELGEVVDVDTSAEARLLEVFPGAEEVR